MLRQMVYISTAARLSKAEVADLLETSQRNNAERQITGFLLYNERNFLQLIEGDPADLRRLMHSLYLDKRHSGVVVLENVEVSWRAFPAWHMEQLAWAADIGQRRAQLEAGLAGLHEPRVRQTVLNFAALN